MLDLRVDPSSHVPPSVQLVDAVLDAVAAGVLEPGSRLPSVRTAAVDALVNPNTIAKSYKELERLGVVTGRNGSGVFVREDARAAARELRRAATLAAFERAAAEALRIGHGVGELEQRLHRLDRQAGKNGGRKRPTTTRGSHR